MKPGALTRLLIDGRCWTTATDRYGHEWITDRYVMARRDCFRPNLPKTSKWDATFESMPIPVRRVLTQAREGIADYHPQATFAGIMAEYEPVQYALVRAGVRYSWINAKVWSAWSDTGLRPHLNSRGQVVWFGDVRGNRTLLAVVMPGRVDGSARVWTTRSAA